MLKTIAINKARASKAFFMLRFELGQMVKRRHCLTFKELVELNFWYEHIKREIEWYKAKIPYLEYVPAPQDEMKVTSYGLKENAILTWRRAIIDRYPKTLRIPTDYFDGKRILDVGCGPHGLALAFTGCEVYGLDPLADCYRELGFPIDCYSDRFICVSGSAESMPFPDNFFDAVISVNAIDHVDDFPAVAREVSRVLRSDGTLRIDVHYHTTTTCEPWSLNDDIMSEHFGHLGIRKLWEGPWCDHTSSVWTNKEQ